MESVRSEELANGKVVVVACMADRTEERLGELQLTNTVPRIKLGNGKTLGLDSVIKVHAKRYRERKKQEMKDVEQSILDAREASSEDREEYEAQRKAFGKYCCWETPPNIQSYTTNGFCRALEFLTDEQGWGDMEGYEGLPIATVPQDDAANPVQRLPELLEIDMYFYKRAGMGRSKVAALRCIFKHQTTAQRFRMWMHTIYAMRDVKRYEAQVEDALERFDRGQLPVDTHLKLCEDNIPKTKWPEPYVLDVQPTMLLLTGPSPPPKVSASVLLGPKLPLRASPRAPPLLCVLAGCCRGALCQSQAHH